MSKAEDKAKELFPLLETDKIGNNPYISYNTEQLSKQEGFIEGYHQAEKDLELTWEDMMLIHRCIKDAMNYHLYKMMEGMEGQKVVYQEVLKRFKEERNKK